MSHSLSIKTFKTSSGCNLIAFDLLLFDVPYFPGVFMMMNETHKGGKNKHLFTDSVNGIASYQLLHRFFKKACIYTLISVLSGICDQPTELIRCRKIHALGLRMTILWHVPMQKPYPYFECDLNIKTWRQTADQKL